PGLHRVEEGPLGGGGGGAERGERRLERGEPRVEERRIGERSQASQRGPGLRVGLGADLRRLLGLVALEGLQRRGVLGERQVALAHQADLLLVPVQLADAEEDEEAEGDEHHRVAEEDAGGQGHPRLPAREWMRGGQPAFSTCWAASSEASAPAPFSAAGGVVPAPVPESACAVCAGGRVRRAISAASAAARSSTERSEAATSSAVSSVRSAAMPLFFSRSRMARRSRSRSSRVRLSRFSSALNLSFRRSSSPLMTV